MTNDIEKQMDEKMDKALQAFSRNLSTIRTGRANPSILNSIFVDYYGASTPLNQLSTIGAPEARMLIVTPFDKSSIGEIEKAIQKANLGLSPSSDGNIIRINIPMLTEERRKEMVKVVGKFAEESRVQIRNVRRDVNEQLKKAEKNGELTEDESRTAQENVQQKTDKFIANLEELAKGKEVEIMEV